MDKIVTLEDVARAAGVGKGTIDRVVHNRGRVAPETRERVLACIRDLNYKPNKAARMLAQRRTYRIAVCYHDMEKEFWQQVGAGIRRAAEEYEQLGVEVVPFILPQIDVDSQLEVIRRVVAEGYDGLAIVPYCADEITGALNDAVAGGMQVVTFNNHEEGINACYVCMDGRQSGRTAGRLMSMIAPPDSRYIALSPHCSHMRQIDERIRGFKEIMDLQRPDMLCVGTFVLDEDTDLLYRIVVDNIDTLKFNAIYVSTGLTFAVGRAIADLGVGDKVRVIGHDLSPTIERYLRSGDIDVTICQEPEEQGYLSVAKICRKLLTGEEIESYSTHIGIVVSENAMYV